MANGLATGECENCWGTAGAAFPVPTEN